MEQVLVHAKQTGGRPKTASLELVRGAADLAERVTGVVAAEVAAAALVAPGLAAAIAVGRPAKPAKPGVYLAFGVSGATQHLVGMRNARHVVAVNTDEHAPILALADLAVVGDAPAVLGRLIGALRAR